MKRSVRWKFVVLCLCAALCGNVAAHAVETETSSWESAMSSGRAAYKERNYAEAESHFKLAASKAKDQTGLVAALRDLLWTQNIRFMQDKSEPPPNSTVFALIAFHQMPVDSQDPASLFGQSMVLSMIALTDQATAGQKLSEALDLLGKGLALSPQDATAYSQRASVYIQLKQYEKAIQDFSKAIEIDPTSQIAYAGRSKTYETLGKHDLAKADEITAEQLKNSNFQAVTGGITQSINLKPADPANYLARANAYVEHGKYQEAADDYSKAIELGARSTETYCERARIYETLKEPQKAIDDYTAAITIDPRNKKAYFWRAKDYVLLGQHQKAMEDYTASLSLWPTNKYIYLERGKVRLTLGDYEKAIADSTQAINRDVDFAEAYSLRSGAYEQMGKHDLARKDKDKAQSLAPKKQ